MARNRVGSQFEWDLARYLQENGFPDAEPRRQGGKNDRGDIAGVPEWVIEAKNTKAIDLAGAMAEAEKEAENAGVWWKVAIFKRRNHRLGKSYVVMTLDQWVELVRKIHYG